jgi:hypothetical protein
MHMIMHRALFAGSFLLAIATAAPAGNMRSSADLLAAPLSFEPNLGQADRAIQFLSRGSGYSLFLGSGEVLLNLEQAPSVHTVRMSLIGANADARAVGLAPQPGVVNYFIGNDPKNWRSGLPTYASQLLADLPRRGPGLLRQSAATGV